jgi:hypothetical protein
MAISKAFPELAALIKILYNKPAKSRASSTTCFELFAISTKGIRVVPPQRPNRSAAYFTGPGLDSQNKALCKGISCL